jgi:hypothetical protein
MIDWIQHNHAIMHACMHTYMHMPSSWMQCTSSGHNRQKLTGTDRHHIYQHIQLSVCTQPHTHYISLLRSPIGTARLIQVITIAAATNNNNTLII